MPRDLAGVPLEFLLFALTLIGVTISHKRALTVALTGLVATTAYKLGVSGFEGAAGLAGLVAHVRHEWVTMANIMLLLVGFAVLAHHFEMSRLPHAIPRLLPKGWMGASCCWRWCSCCQYSSTISPRL